MTELPEHIRDAIDAWILRYPPDQKRSGVFEALRLVQEFNRGHLTVSLMDAVADYLNISRAAVYEVATFYSMYELSPVGEHVIHICRNVPCMLKGADTAAKYLKEKLNINFNETTPDKKFTLKEVECLGACINAPVCQIGHDYHENLNKEKIDQLILNLKNKNYDMPTGENK